MGCPSVVALFHVTAIEPLAFAFACTVVGASGSVAVGFDRRRYGGGPVPIAFVAVTEKV